MGHEWWMAGEALFWLVFIVAAIWLAVGLATSSVPAPGGHSPVEILEQRFARGEVSPQDLEERRRDLIETRDGDDPR